MRGWTARHTIGVGIAEAPDRLEHAVVVGAAAGADAQVDRGAGEALAGILAAQLDLHVLVHDRDAGVAARVARLRAQQLVEVGPIGHACTLLADGETGGGQAGAELAPGVEEVLVDRVAVGAELQGEHVDRDVVEGDRHEDLPLALGQVRRDRRASTASCSRRSACSPGSAARVSGSWSNVRSRARRMVLPGVPRELARGLEDHELVGPGREAAAPPEVVELGEDVHRRVVGALLRDVVELVPARELPAAAVQLVQRRAPQDVVELRDGVLVARVGGTQLLDPAPRGRVHAPIVVSSSDAQQRAGLVDRQVAVDRRAR